MVRNFLKGKKGNSTGGLAKRHGRTRACRPLFASFLASTVLPGGSEAALWGFLQLHPDALWPALGLATLGNTLGGLTSWLCGRYPPRWQRLEDLPQRGNPRPLGQSGTAVVVGAADRRCLVRRRRLAAPALAALHAVHGAGQIRPLPVVAGVA